MKWADVMKKLGINLEEEVPVEELTPEQKAAKEKADKEAADKKAADDKAAADKKAADDKEAADKAAEEAKKKEEEAKKMADKKLYEDGWFNPDTLELDETKIHDEGIKAYATALKNKSQKDKLNSDVNAAIDAMLSDKKSGIKVKISSDMLKKTLDLSGVKVGKDGKLEGVKEAIEALRTKEPGLFEKVRESSPLHEGFSPANKTEGNAGVISSDAAWASREA